MSKLRPHVLIVDDYPDVAQMLQSFIERAGYDTTVAHSGQAALAAAQKTQFDIIISDIGMPEMNGYELAGRLRATAEYKTTPMIAFTGFAMYDDRDRALRAGFNHHLCKPIMPPTMLALLATIRDRL